MNDSQNGVHSEATLSSYIQQAFNILCDIPTDLQYMCTLVVRT